MSYKFRINDYFELFCQGCCFNWRKIKCKRYKNRIFNDLAKPCLLWKYAAEKFSLPGSNSNWTFRGSMRYLYSLQQSHGRTRKNPDRYMLKCSYLQFEAFLLRNGYRRMYIDWLRSKFDPEMKPVIRKKRYHVDYDLQNIQLIVKIDT
jgi:hypothetical protein